MTDHEHAEVSRRLALAIGWRQDLIYSAGDGSYCAIIMKDCRGLPYGWKLFDYRDPLVIWPIAERFASFPHCNLEDRWHVTMRQYLVGENFDTAALAVARTVIAAQEGK